MYFCCGSCSLYIVSLEKLGGQEAIIAGHGRNGQNAWALGLETTEIEAEQLEAFRRFQRGEEGFHKVLVEGGVERLGVVSVGRHEGLVKEELHSVLVSDPEAITVLEVARLD